MKPAAQLTLGAAITVAGLLLLGFSVDIAKWLTSEHVFGVAVAFFFLGLGLVCLGVWRSGARIKFPP